MSDDKSRFNVNISANAKASLDVKAEIPKESTGRFIDTLTDIIRPYTEKRGLEADRIRLKREEILLEIAQKTKIRLELTNKKAVIPPSKFIVRFLESASLEEKDSKLVDMWSSLLASASTNYQDDYVTYIDILANITSAEARILKNIIPRTKYTSMSVFVSGSFMDGFSKYIQQLIALTPDLNLQKMRKILLIQSKGEKVNDSSISSIADYKFDGDPWRDSDPDVQSEVLYLLESLANQHHCKFLSIFQSGGKGKSLLLGKEFIYYSALANLEKHRLLERRDLKHDNNGVVTTAEWMTVTPLCLNLMEACSER